VIIAFTALDETDVRQRLADEEIDAYCLNGNATTHLMQIITTLVSGYQARPKKKVSP
jgi:AmiR/NasT family two-component response regulator